MKYQRISCQLCCCKQLLPVIEFDNCPLSNRYLKKSEPTDSYVFTLKLVQCENCALLQLSHFPDPLECAPQYDWILYREAEGHLDSLADRLCKLPGVALNNTIAGITYKDDSLLTRLHDRLDCKTWRIDPLSDLDISIRNAGSESVLLALNSKNIKRIIHQHGQADLLVARHVFEHAYDAQSFLDACSQLVKPNGYLIVEVPDCKRNLEAFDYSMLWEEHALYLTESTFKNAFSYSQFSPLAFYSYPYAIENAMVAIVKNDGNIQKNNLTDKNDFFRVKHYKNNFHIIKTNLHHLLSTKKMNRENIAVFGAGHTSSMFINIMEIKRYISFVVDNDVNKTGLYMPGSHLPIVASEQLLAENITSCFMGLSPESETAVRQNNHHLLQSVRDFIRIAALSQALNEGGLAGTPTTVV